MTGDALSDRLATVAHSRERQERVRSLLLAEVDRLYSRAIGDWGAGSRTARIYEHALRKAADGNFTFMRQLAHLKRIPVTIDEFTESNEFLGSLQSVWPLLRGDIARMNPDIFTGEEPVREALLGGATGTGKTTLSYTTNAYQVYLFTCFNHPQVLYGLSTITPIVFMMQSVSATITKRIIYRPFRDMFTAMPYAQKWLTWDKRRESELVLKDGILVVPALANLESILGQAIAGGMLDEVNFMRIIEDSKQAVGSRGKGGTYDQARDVYDNIERRQQRSFQTRGYSMGVLCVLSSTRYKADFLDQRMDEVGKFGIKGILCLRRKQYEVVPQDRFTGEKFRIVVGTDDYPTQVIEEGMVAGKDYPENATIEEIPVEYRDRFRTDPDGALRDICGIATDTISPFITQRHKIVDSIVRYREAGLKPICRADIWNFARQGMPQWDDAVLEGMSKEVREAPRFVHIDLALTGDACGVSVVRHAGFIRRPVKGVENRFEVLPKAIVEAAVAIKPDKSHEIQIAEVRRWVMQLRDFYGLNIFKVTYDGFQSVESRQHLTHTGVRTERVSVDLEVEPYNELRDAFYDDRIDMPELDHLRSELIMLEYSATKRKVDHPPKGSKDAADAVTGALYSLRKARMTRTEMGVVDSQGDKVRASTRDRRTRNKRRK